MMTEELPKQAFLCGLKDGDISLDDETSGEDPV